MKSCAGLLPFFAAQVRSGKAATPMLTGRDRLPSPLMFSPPHLTSCQCKLVLEHTASHPFAVGINVKLVQGVEKELLDV